MVMDWKPDHGNMDFTEGLYFDIHCLKGHKTKILTNGQLKRPNRKSFYSCNEQNVYYYLLLKILMVWVSFVCFSACSCTLVKISLSIIS